MFSRPLKKEIQETERRNFRRNVHTKFQREEFGQFKISDGTFFDRTIDKVRNPIKPQIKYATKLFKISNNSGQFTYWLEKELKQWPCKMGKNAFPMKKSHLEWY